MSAVDVYPRFLEQVVDLVNHDQNHQQCLGTPTVSGGLMMSKGIVSFL